MMLANGVIFTVDSDLSGASPHFKVGLYNSGGGIVVKLNDYANAHMFAGDTTFTDGMMFTLDFDLNGASPQFNLTCISTGGPATTVTWTRHSDNVTEGTDTSLDDRVIAQYTHAHPDCAVRLGGLYTCTMANNKPSEDSAYLTVQGTYQALLLQAVQSVC